MYDLAANLRQSNFVNLSHFIHRLSKSIVAFLWEINRLRWSAPLIGDYFYGIHQKNFISK